MTEAPDNQDTERVSVRLATVSDGLMLARLRYAFRSSLASSSEAEQAFARRCAGWMQERLRAGTAWKCWLAERDQTLAGHLWLQVIEKIPNPAVEPEYHAYLTNFYVRAEARGKGVGSTLLATALDWCRAHDVHAVILWPTEKSRSLYLRHGFAVRNDLMELIVEDG